MRRSVGYMPDNFGVYDGMKVWEFLDFFAVAYQIPRARRKQVIGDVLELLDLTHKRDDFVNGLSRGMKQRLCLAKTLVHDPPVLILDEPSSGLDPRARLEVKALLKELRRMGKTILISSHILTELADCCTSIGIIERGNCIATHGRGFWILDNITPLRQLLPNESGPAEAGSSGGTSFRSSTLKTQLFKPQTAMRVRWNTNTDTPLPPDEPVGENPPEGAMIDYSLGKDTSGPVTLEIKDGKGNLVRRYASTDRIPPPDPTLKIPRYWVRSPQALSATPGLHRFLWDLHGQPLPDAEAEYPMTAVAYQTAPEPTAPWVVPGNYSITLTSGGKTFTQPLPLKMDPRVKASATDLAQQFDFSKELEKMRAELEPIGKSYKALVSELDRTEEAAAAKGLREKIDALRKKLESFANPAAVYSGGNRELDALNKVKKLFGDLQQVDAAPTPQQQAAVSDLQRAAPAVIKQWKAMPREIAALNSQLEAAGLQPLSSRAE